MQLFYEAKGRYRINFAGLDRVGGKLSLCVVFINFGSGWFISLLFVFLRTNVNVVNFVSTVSFHNYFMKPKELAYRLNCASLGRGGGNLLLFVSQTLVQARL